MTEKKEFKKSDGIGYKATSKNGLEFINLNIDGVKYVMFKNKNKKEERHPDFQIFKSETQEKKEDVKSNNDFIDDEITF